MKSLYLLLSSQPNQTITNNLKALADLFGTASRQENFVHATIHQSIEEPKEFLLLEVWNKETEHFMNVTLKQPYVLEWEQLLVGM